jgi:hypothetical protein
LDVRTRLVWRHFASHVKLFSVSYISLTFKTATPVTLKRKNEEEIATQSAKRILSSFPNALIHSQISNCSALLEEWLTYINKLSCMDLLPEFEEYELPDIPEGLKNQRVFVYLAQLRQRNVYGGAMVAGAHQQLPRQRQPPHLAQPPRAMHNGRPVTHVDIGRMNDER